MTGLFMLDTDMASYVIKGTSPTLDAHLRQLDVRDVCISAITRAELKYGVRIAYRSSRLAARVDLFLSGVPTLPWGEDAADVFAQVRADLVRSGTPIGSMDAMIAAHALAVGAILVTNNVRHFKRVKDLKVENWTR